MAGNKNSGRRVRKDEERQELSRFYPEAVSVLGDLLKARSQRMRFEAARTIIEYYIGKPSQGLDIEHAVSDSVKELLARYKEVASN